MNRRHLRYAADSPSSTKWWLRNHMAFVVDNLQYYLQVIIADDTDTFIELICRCTLGLLEASVLGDILCDKNR